MPVPYSRQHSHSFIFTASSLQKFLLFDLPYSRLVTGNLSQNILPLHAFSIIFVVRKRWMAGMSLALA